MAQPGPERDYELPHAAPFHNEGKTFAGWLLFWVVCIGAAVTAAGFIVWQLWLVIVGAVIAVGGVAVSKILSAMGMGQPGGGNHARQSGEPDWYA
ncbi:hypothetical protein [Georgenia sunbinii]|uniref:hypothetical protein n=1 Tax=Georgenia sunbinii TaxID=3117728 RepID=UPI002F266F99